MNKYIPGRTKKQYRIDNRDQINEKQNQYDKNHIDEKKKYQEANKEKISIRNKLYYQAKLAKLNQVEIEVAVIDDQNNIITVLDV